MEVRECDQVVCCFPRLHDLFEIGVVILLVFYFCDNSMREKDWRCCKRGMQATKARQGDLAGVTHAR